jgi:phage tail-like protein
LDHLPAIYRRPAAGNGIPAIQTFLSAFEAVLFCSDETGAHRSLQESIDAIATLYDPYEVSADFLPWLAQWAALTLNSVGMTESQLRNLIAVSIPLYAIRGTKAYLQTVLQLYTGGQAVVEELYLPGMCVGVRSSVGHDTRLGEDPFQFQVSLTFASAPVSREGRLNLQQLAHAVIRLAKPAHTHYRLTDNLTETVLGLKIAVRSTVGVDTLLWKPAERK